MDDVKSLRGKIQQMSIGDTILVSLELYKWETCRYYASTIGMTENRKYSVSFNRKNLVCSIKRVS